MFVKALHELLCLSETVKPVKEEFNRRQGNFITDKDVHLHGQDDAHQHKLLLSGMSYEEIFQ